MKNFYMFINKFTLLTIFLVTGLTGFSQTSPDTTYFNFTNLTGLDGSSSMYNELSAWWDLDEASGTTVVDSFGVNKGTNSGATVNQSGKINSAYDFESSESDYLTMPSSNLSFAVTDPFSISSWIYIETNQVQYIFSKMDNNTGWPNIIGYGLWLESDGDVTFALKSSDGNSTGGAIYARANANLATGTWHHILVTYDGSQLLSGVNIYVNNSSPSYASSTDSWTSGDITNTDSVNIGSFDSGGDTYFDGKIDQVAVWDRDLTSSEANSLYGGGSGIEFNELFTEATDGFDQTDMQLSSDCAVVTGFRAEIDSNNYTHIPYITEIIAPDGTVFSPGATYTKGVEYTSSAILHAADGTWGVKLSEPIDPVTSTGTLARARIIYEYVDSPVAVCKDTTLLLDNTGSASLTAADLDGGSQSCAIGIASMTLSQSSFDVTDVGTVPVTLTVTDNNANSNTCVSNVTVEGVLSTLDCQDITVYLWANGQYVLKSRDIDSIANFDTSFGSTDDITVSVSPRSFDCIHANTDVRVKITASDVGGNKNVCYANVTVKDTIGAEVSCIDSLEVYLDETGEARIFPGQIKDKLVEGDPCGSSSLWLSQSVFSCADVGSSMITLTSADPSGNESTCTTKIIVHDTFPPMVEEIEDIEIMVDPGVCETAIEYPVPVVMDNCDVSLEQTEGLGADGMFPLGTTTETWVVTDEGGNSVTLSFSVIVTTTNDAPTLDEVEDVSVVEDTPTLNVELTGISGGMDCETQVVTVTAENSNTDLITEVMVNYTDGNTGSLDLTIAPEMSGEAEITVMVEDAEGAVDTAMFMVTVTAENDPPYLINPIPDQVVNASYALKIPVSTVVGEYFGDVDDDMLTFSAILDDGSDLPAWMMMSIDTLVAEPMIEDTGCVVVIVAATDAAGATATDTFEVCVDGYPVSIDEIDADQFEVKLYPNPTQGIVNIDISSSKIYDVELSVIDITGKQLLRKQYSAAERITFNLENNVSGMYFVKLNFDGKQVLKKVILDR